MTGKRWTEKEIDYLARWYGDKSVQEIADKLNRSFKGVKEKAIKLGYGKTTGYTEYLTGNELSKALNVSYWKVYDWIKNKKLPADKKILYKTRPFFRIDIQKFWKWASKNKKYIKWYKVPKYALGPEPIWVNEARKNVSDIDRKKDSKWTKEEIEKVKFYWNKGYKVSEISKAISRTENTVRLMASRNHISSIVKINWKPIETKTLISLASKGYTNIQIAEELGRSSNMVKHKKAKLKKQGLI